jgi:hypothetical protein
MEFKILNIIKYVLNESLVKTISVVLPVYNVNYDQRMYRSILNQTFQDFEIIL